MTARERKKMSGRKGREKKKENICIINGLKYRKNSDF